MRSMGCLGVDTGVTALALTTTPVLVNAFSQSTGLTIYDGNAVSGNYSIIPDKANNRFKILSAGVFYVHADLSVLISGANQYVLQLRKNGTTLNGAIKTVQQAADTNRVTLSLCGIIVITPADNPKTIQTMAAASVTGFSGASGAPYVETILELMASVTATTGQITVESGCWTVYRVDED